MDEDTVLYRQADSVCATRLITFRCNNNCLCCIAPSESRSKKEYSWAQLRKALAAIPKNALTIDLNGGEPSCTPHLPKVLGYLKRNLPKAGINILTNGRAFSYPSYLASLDIPANSKFVVALYGINPENHDSITLSPGSFQQSVAGIRNLIQSGHKVEIRIIVTRKNFETLPAIAAYVKRHFPGVRLVFVNAKYTGQAFRNRRSLFIRTSRITPYLTRAVARARGMDIRLYHFPYCLLPEKIWKHVPGMTVPERDICFGPVCGACRMRERCPGVWRSYAKLAGFKELRPL